MGCLKLPYFIVTGILRTFSDIYCEFPIEKYAQFRFYLENYDTQTNIYKNWGFTMLSKDNMGL